MSGLASMWRVASREIRERGRSKAYLVTLAVTLLIVLGLILVPQLIDGGPDEVELGLVGTGNEEIVAAAEQLAAAGVEPGGEPSMIIGTTPLADLAAARQALEAGEVRAVLVDGREILTERAPGFGGLAAFPLLGLLQQAAASVELERLLAEEGRAAADVIAVMTSDPLELTTLTGDDVDDVSRSVVAYAGLILLYIAVLLYGTWILTGVTEEKSNRVVEVLLSSMRPWQLLGGKIIGIGTLGLAQFAGTIIVAAVALELSGALEFPAVDAATVINLVVWFILGFLLYAVLFGAAGSLVSRPEEAQNISFPMTLLGIVGFILAITALNSPDGAAALVGTFLPLAAPFVIPVRTTLDAIPVWQYGAGLALTVASIVGLVLLAGRIYAGGVLRVGARVKVRDAWRGAAD